MAGIERGVVLAPGGYIGKGGSTVVNRLVKVVCLALGIQFAVPTAVCAQSTSVPTNGDTPQSTQVLNPSELNGSLTVSEKNIVVIDLGAQSSVSLSGNLTNAGSIYAISTNPAVTTGSITATNIVNLAGASITTVLPTGGLPGFSNALSNFNLILNAVGNITNYGTISGANDLTAIAGSSITNYGVMQAAGNLTAIAPDIQNLSATAGLTAIMNAAGNLNISTANLVNQGVLASANANINVASVIASSLQVNNTAGLMQALNGAINFGTADLIGKIDTTIAGGDFLSKELNIYSGCGVASLDGEQITGSLNIYAGEAHVNAATPVLSLGSIHLSGDPTFFNKVGDIVINTDLVFPGAALALVAQGNIITAAGAGKIDTSSPTGNGGEITLVAGANFVTTAGCCVKPGQPGDTTSTLSILGGSIIGGNIDLKSGTAITSLTSRSTGGNGDGGKITLVAFGNQAGLAGYGNIVLPDNVTLTSGGSGTGKNGDVTVIAGAPGGTAISIGGIDATGGAGASASVELTASPPAVYLGPASCAPCVTIQNGAITGGTFSVGYLGFGSGSVLVNGSIKVDGTGSQNGGKVTISSDASNFVFGAGATTTGVKGTISARGGTAGGAGGEVTVYVGNTITLSSANDVNVSPFSGNGGKITLGGGTLIAPSLTLDARAAGAGDFDGGELAIYAGSIVTTGGPLIVDASAVGGGKGGTLNLLDPKIGNGNNQIRAIANGGSAGSVTGDGGLLMLSSNFKSSVLINTSALDLRPLGVNGNGGVVSGYIYVDSFSVVGTLDLSGVGTGNGGRVELTMPYNGSGGMFTIGGAAAQGFSGGIIVDAGAAGAKGGTVSVNTQSDLTLVSAASISAVAANGSAGIMRLTSNKVMTLPSGNLSLNGGAGNSNGGELSFTANTFNIGGPIAISAKGSGGGSGGIVGLKASSGSLTIGAAQISLDVSGGSPGSSSGDAGSIKLEAPNMTVVSTSAMKLQPLGLNGGGGELEILVMGNVSITGDLDVSGVGFGDGGSVTLQTGRQYGGVGTSMVIGGGPTVNGVSGNIIANAGLLGGSGGKISLQAQNTGNNLTITSASNLQFATTEGNGGSLRLYSAYDAQLFIVGGKYDANAVGSGNYNGGTIALSKLSPVTLDLQASATGSGDGGYIRVPESIGFGANQAQIRATGGSAGSASGKGGHVLISGYSGTNLTIDPAALDLRPLGTNGDGATIEVYNDGNSLRVFGSLSADGVGTGNGGRILLMSRIGAFRVGSSAVSGIDGPVTANGGAAGGIGGEVQFQALGGNLVIDSPALLSATGTRGGLLNLFGFSNLNFSSGGVLGSSGTTRGGSLYIRFGGSMTTTGNLQMVVDGIGTGDGGSIQIELNGGLTLGNGAGQFFMSANGGAVSGNAGFVHIETIGALNVSSGFSAQVLGSNGNGATLSFLTNGALTLPASLAADGKGTGYGGEIVLKYTSAGQYTIGGSISASASGTGLPGVIVIQNRAATHNLRVTGSISAVGAGGAKGPLVINSITDFYDFFDSDLVDVNKDVVLSGNGLINAEILAGGRSFNANMGSPLTFALIRTSGDINVTAPSVSVVRYPSEVGVPNGYGYTGWFGDSWGGPSSAFALWNNLPASAAIFTDTNITINSPSITNSGFIGSNAAGTVTLTNAGVLNVGGTGMYATNGGVLTLSGTSVNLSDSSGFAAGTGTVNLTAGAGGTITSANCTIQTVLTASALNITTSKLDFTGGLNLTNLAVNSPVNFIAAASDLNITVDVNQAPVIRTNGGGINLQSSPGFNINVTPSGPGGGKMTFIGGPVSFTNNGGTVNIANNVTISTDNNLTFNLTNSSLNNNGVLESTGGTFGGFVQVAGTGNVSVGGTGAIYAGLPSTTGQINIQTNAVLTLGGTLALNTGVNGGIAIGGASVSLAPGSNLAIADVNLFRVDTPALTFGAGSKITTQQQTGGFYIGSGATPLMVSLPGGSSATIDSSGGTGVVFRTVFGGNTIRFASDGTPGTASLNVVGAAGTNIQQTNNIQVDANVRLFADSPFLLSTNANFINNGTVVGGGATPSVQVVTFGVLTVSGTGTVSTATPGSILIGTSSNNDLVLNGNQTFNPGAGGVVTLASGGAALNLSAGTTQTVSQGATMNLQSASINLGAGAAVVATDPSTNIVLSANRAVAGSVVAGGPLTITLPSNSSSTFATAGGSIAVNGFQSLSVNTSGAGASTLFLNGGAANVSGPAITVQNGANLASDNSLSLIHTSGAFNIDSNISASTTLSITAAGAITRSGGVLTGATVALAAGGGADIGTAGQQILTAAGALSLSTTGAVYLNEADSVNLNTSNVGSLVLNTASNGNIGLAGNVGATGSVTLNANGSGAITNAGGFTITAASLGLSSGSGDLGASNAPIINAGSSLGFSTGGDVYLRQSTSALNLGVSSADDFTLSTSVDVAINGGLTAGSINLAASGAANVIIGSNVDVTGTAAITSGTGSVTIDGGARLQSSSGNVQVSSSQITNNGLIATNAAGGQVSFTSPSASLNMGGTGSVSASGGGASAITASAATVSLSGLSFDSGAAGTITLNGSTAVALGGVTTIANGSGVVVSTPLFDMAAGSQLSATGASAVGVQSPGAALQVRTPDGATGTISSNGGSVSFSAAAAVSITKSAGGSTGTLSVSGSAVSFSPANGSMTVAANTVITNPGDESINVSALTNDGIIHTAGTLLIQNPNSIVVSGSGQLNGGSASFSSTNGAATITEGSIGSVVTGSSSGNFTLTAGGSSLNVGDVSSASGAISLTSSAGTLIIQDTSTVSAATDVILTGATGLNLGTIQGGTTIQAGGVNPMVNALSTNMADFDMSSITSPGRILLSTGAGGITLAQNARLQTFGGSLGLRAPGNINIGTNAQLFAQGGNIWLNGLGDINIAGGASFTAVARNVPAGAPVAMPVAGVSIAAFQGGSIALDVDSLQANYDSYLRSNWEQQRTAAGAAVSSGGGIDTTGTSMVFSDGGTVALVTTNPNKVSGTFLNVLNSTINASGGVIYIDPPGSQVNVANAIFQAFGPQLVAVPPGPVVIPPVVAVAGGGGALVVPVAAVAGAPLAGTILVADTTSDAMKGQSARIVPLDTLDLNVPLATPGSAEKQCVPSPLAQFVESEGKDGGWAVAAGFCESFSVEGSNGTAVVSAGGTQLSPGDANSLRMKQGKMLAMAGKSGLAVVAGDARVSVAGDSSMMIEESTRGVLRITQLSGAPGAIEIGRNGQKKIIPTQAGHEILVSVGDPEQEELIAVDGIDRIPVGATMKVADLQVRRSQVDPKQLLERSNLLNCSTSGCFPARLRAKLNRLKEQAGAPRKPPAVSHRNMQELQHPYKSVGFVQSALPVHSPVATMTCSAGLVKHTSDAKFSMVSPGTIVLREGELILSPERRTVVSNGTARIEVEPGAIALIARDGNCLRVRVLWENSPGKIVARGGGGHVSVRAGQEAVVATSVTEMAGFIKKDNTARRRVVKLPSSTGESLLLSEVSFLGTVNDSMLLSSILKSLNPEDRTLRDRVLKMAVVLSVVTSRHGNYTPVKPNN